MVYDCDDFTRAYYRYRLGIELEPIKVEEGQKRAIVHEVPPYNGYGSPEDSLGSVYSLQPKPPKKDMTKLFTNDHFVVRFDARLMSESRDPFPLLLRKQKLPKQPLLTHYPGMSLTK